MSTIATIATIDQIKAKQAFHTCGTRIDFFYVGHGGGGYAACLSCFVRPPANECLTAPTTKAA